MSAIDVLGDPVATRAGRGTTDNKDRRSDATVAEPLIELGQQLARLLGSELMRRVRRVIR
ncbi:MAG: hypothetical protein ACR2FV_02770 [Ornithinimicrobium sp.]|uniref:hypothetical protein n=1 Tax=Ornithinimicrobium sp. TaxID=1977084 RepID=UPI003D9AC1E3